MAITSHSLSRPAGRHRQLHSVAGQGAMMVTFSEKLVGEGKWAWVWRKVVQKQRRTGAGRQ